MHIHSHLKPPHRYFERVLNILNESVYQLLEQFQQIEANVTMHFPICFAQMNKLLLLGFLMICPLVIPQELGLAQKVAFPTLAAYFFLGIEYVSIEIEVPFGSDNMDIKILRFLR